MAYEKSAELLNHAQELIPGGVNSPVRAFKGVGGTPPFITRAEGATMSDEDGQTYVDFVLSWGPMILGHGHSEVKAALSQALEKGTSYGAPTRLEVDMAQLVCDLVPSIDMVRMVNSGTEATMSAIRLARGATGKDGVVKVEGCYHGHGDYLLVAAGSGATTFGVPSSPGVPKGMTETTYLVPFNDLDALKTLFEAQEDKLACFILEPVPGNMGMILPDEGYLQGVRELCCKHGVLLIFDEVMSGFRVHLGGAQALYGVMPDLTCLGKVIGGGLPVGAYGGSKELMNQVSPAGPIYQAGTLSGNPLAMSAGYATLKRLQADDPYADLQGKAEAMLSAWEEAAKEKGVPFSWSARGSMFGFFFTETPPRSYAEAHAGAGDTFNRFFHGMLSRGTYLAPSSYEAGFLSTAHSDEQLKGVADKGRQVIADL